MRPRRSLLIFFVAAAGDERRIEYLLATKRIPRLSTASQVQENMYNQVMGMNRYPSEVVEECRRRRRKKKPEEVKEGLHGEKQPNWW